MAVLVLAALAAYGLSEVFDGWRVVGVGTVGALGGVVGAWLSTARKLTPLTTMLVLVGVFVVGAGPASPEHAIAGLLPGPGTPVALAEGLVQSWNNLLTTALPVALSAGLGVIPYVLGFVAGAGGALIAYRTAMPLLPALLPLGSLIGSFLLGDAEPRSVLVQGAGFLVVALAWAAHRGNRERRNTEGIYWPRLVGAAVMLALLVPVGAVAGRSLPLVDREREVLREDVEPPFDVENYGSPLGKLRAYRKAKADSERAYMTMTGFPEGGRIRLATMDAYDGVVWTVTDDDDGSGRFKRVGSEVRPVPPWDAAQLDVVIADGGYSDVWIPSIGTIRSLSFSGEDAANLTSSFRYNPVTGTAATPLELRPGNRYHLDVRIPPEPDEEALADARVGTFTASYPEQVGSVMAKLTEEADTLTQSATTPYGKAKALADGLSGKGFYFSDDEVGAAGAADVPAGHSIARLDRLMTERVGNHEQYAAAMALMAQQLGLPSRVVMGFDPKGSGSVKVTGSDAVAWVEIEFAGHGWVPFDPTPPETQPPVDVEPPPDTTPRDQQPIPPVTYVEPPPTIPPDSGRDTSTTQDPPDSPRSANGIPRWVRTVATYGGPPLAVVGCIVAAIVGLKALRRRRRRTKGSVVDQINGAWQEAVDRLRDLGHRPSPSATRRELAGAAESSGIWPSGLVFADTIDAHMFGPTDPASPSATATWTDLEEHVKVLHAPLTKRQRVRAATSIASLRRRTEAKRGDGRGALVVAERAKSRKGSSDAGAARRYRLKRGRTATSTEHAELTGQVPVDDGSQGRSVPVASAMPATPLNAGPAGGIDAERADLQERSSDATRPTRLPDPPERPSGQ